VRLQKTVYNVIYYYVLSLHINRFVYFVSLCLHRLEFSKRSEREHIEPAGEGKTDGVEEQMVERETRGRSVSG